MLSTGGRKAIACIYLHLLNKGDRMKFELGRFFSKRNKLKSITKNIQTQTIAFCWTV